MEFLPLQKNSPEQTALTIGTQLAYTVTSLWLYSRHELSLCITQQLPLALLVKRAQVLNVENNNA